MCMNLDHVASGHFVLWKDILCEFNYWPLAVSMPPTKACQQCKDAVPVGRKTCERCDLVFRSKRKAECIKLARENSLTMKLMGAAKSDSVKSARKAKDKLHETCQRASETCERTLHGQEQNRMRMARLRESHETVIVSSQHTCTITCTAAPSVWHFSVFHLRNVMIYTKQHCQIMDFIFAL